MLDPRLASCHLRTFIATFGFSEIFMDFRGSRVKIFQNGKVVLVAPIHTFARFQAGFLSSEDFDRIY